MIIHILVTSTGHVACATSSEEELQACLTYRCEELVEQGVYDSFIIDWGLSVKVYMLKDDIETSITYGLYARKIGVWQ